ncbi:uncharacterized protein LOC144444491 [Glandiceps talaboti]
MSDGLNAVGLHDDAVSIATSAVSGISDSIISSSPSVIVQRVDAGIPTWSLTAAEGLEEQKESHSYLDDTTECLLADDPLKQIEVLNSDQSRQFDCSDPIKNMLTDDNPMLSGGSLHETSTDFLLGHDVPLVPSVFDSSGESLNTSNPFGDVATGAFLQEGSIDNVMKDHNYVNYGDEIDSRADRENVRSMRSSTRAATRSTNQVYQRRNVKTANLRPESDKRELRSSGRNQKEESLELRRNTPPSPRRSSRGGRGNPGNDNVEMQRGSRSLRQGRGEERTKRERQSKETEDEQEGKSLKQVQEEMRRLKTRKVENIPEGKVDNKDRQKVGETQHKYRRTSDSDRHDQKQGHMQERRRSEGERSHLERQHSHDRGQHSHDNKGTRPSHHTYVKHKEHERQREHVKHEHDTHRQREQTEPNKHDRKHSASDEQGKQERKHSSSDEHGKHERRRLSSVSDEPILFTPDTIVKSIKPETHDSHADDSEQTGVNNEKMKTQKGEDDDTEDSLTYVDDENDSDWCSEDDPDKLWCICKQPHDNRFMISCDSCNEWYHGKCVGVTKRQGKEMERTGSLYKCTVCVDKDKKKEKDSKATNPPQPGPKKSDEQSAEKSDTPDKKKKIRFFKKPVPQQQCVGSLCNKQASSNSVFCSNECIGIHVRVALKIIEREREKTFGIRKDSRGGRQLDTKLKDSDTVAVIERHTGRVLAGLSAPTVTNLEEWIIKHPTFEVLRPGTHGYDKVSHATKDLEKAQREKMEMEKEREKRERERDRASRDKDKSKDRGKDKKDRRSSQSKAPSSQTPQQDTQTVRLNVRKMLKDLLVNRAKDAKDIKLKAEEIERVVNKIEHQLYKLFQDTGTRYKTRYRTLIFNLRDTKNKGLFRRVLKGDIPPAKLVKMSSEEMASKELSEWREREAKHTLEMIKAEAALKQTVHLTKKTHKGEIEIEEDNLADLESHNEKSKQTEKGESTGGGISGMLVDTTDQHKTHLFDLNCKICTGKMIPPAEEPLKKAKVAVSFGKGNNHETSSLTTGVTKSFQEVSSVKSEETSTSSSMLESPRQSMSREIVSTSPELPSPEPYRAKPTRVSETPSPEPYRRRATSVSVWKGFVMMQNLAKFVSIAYRVSGPTDHLMTDLPDTIHLCGRISFEQVWDYLGKIRTSATKDICVIRLEAATKEEEMSYVSLYSYFNSRKRCGVVGNNTKHVKDMYLIPLAAHRDVPSSLQPFDGPGLEEERSNMLLGVIIRQKRHRHSLPSHDPTHVSPRKTKRHHSVDFESAQIRKRRFTDEESMESKSPPLSSVIEECVLKEKEEDIHRKAQRASQKSVFISEEQYNDPIVRQYANADPSTLVAAASEIEEAPYSPGQEYQAEEEAKPYDPTDDVMGEVSDNDLADDDDDISDIMDDTESPLINPDSGSVSAVTQSGIVGGASGQILTGVSFSSAASQSSAGMTSDSETELKPLSVDPKLSEQQQKLDSLAKELELAKKALLETQIQNLQVDISRTSNTLATVASQALDPKDEGTVAGASSGSELPTESHDTDKTVTPTTSVVKSAESSSESCGPGTDTKADTSEDDTPITIPGLGFETSTSSIPSFLSPSQEFLSSKSGDEDASAGATSSSNVDSQGHHHSKSSDNRSSQQSASRRSSAEGGSSSRRDSREKDRGQTYESFDDRPFVRYEYDKDGRRVRKDDRHERDRDRDRYRDHDRDRDRDRDHDRDRDRDRSRSWGRDDRRWQESRGSSSHRSHDRDRHDRDRWRQDKDRHRR